MVSDAKPPRAKPVLAYLVTEDWYFLSHRLPMALAAQRAGYDVHVISHINEGAAAIEAPGFRLHAVVWRRGSLNPFGFLSNMLAVRRIYRQIVPDLVTAMAFLRKRYDKHWPSALSVITGPSRTADIELTLTRGVHGPKEVHAIFVDQVIRG